MLGIGRGTRIYLAVGATDMRKGFEGLYGLVRDRLQCEPLSGHVFLFIRQCAAQSAETDLLGWQRTLGLCQKIIARQILLAPATGGRSQSRTES